MSPPQKTSSAQAHACYTVLYEGVTLHPGEAEDHFSAVAEVNINSQKEAGCYVALVSERDRSALPEAQRKLVDLQMGARDWKKLNKKVRQLARQNRARVHSDHSTTLVNAHGALDKKGRHRIRMTKDGYEIYLNDIKKETRRLRTQTHHVVLSSCESGVKTFLGYRNMAVVTMGAQNEITSSGTFVGILSTKNTDASFLQLIQAAHEKNPSKASFLQYYGKFAATDSGKIIEGSFSKTIEVIGYQALTQELEKMKKVGAYALVLYLDDESPWAARNYIGKLNRLNKKYRGTFKCIIARAPRGSRGHWQAHGIVLNPLRPTLDWIGPNYRQTHRVKNTLNPMGRDYLDFTLITQEEIIDFYQKYIDSENDEELLEIFNLFTHDKFEVVEKLLPKLFEMAKGNFKKARQSRVEDYNMQLSAYSAFFYLTQDNLQIVNWLRMKLEGNASHEDKELAFAILCTHRQISSKQLIALVKDFLEKDEGDLHHTLLNSVSSFFRPATKFSEEDLQTLASMLQDSDLPIKFRIHLAETLWKRGNDYKQPTSLGICRIAFDFLLFAIKSLTPEVRDEVFDGLLHVYYHNRLIPMKNRKLTKALETETDPSIQFYLMALLKQDAKTPLTKEEIAFWIKGLHHEDLKIVKASLEQLKLTDPLELQANAEILIPTLQTMLKHSVTGIKMDTCKLLALLGEKAKVLLPDLRKLSEDDWDHTVAESLMAREKIGGPQEVSVAEWQALWARPLMIPPGKENNPLFINDAEEHRAFTLKDYFQLRGYDEVVKQAIQNLVVEHFEEMHRRKGRPMAVFDGVLDQLSDSISELEQLRDLLQGILNNSEVKLSSGARQLIAKEIETIPAKIEELQRREQSRKQAQQLAFPFDFTDKNFIFESMKLLHRQ